jgi:hypothetical protein
LTAYTLDTSRSDADWQTIGLGGKGEGGTPKGRRSHLGVTFGNGKGVFVFGGGEGANGLERVLDDAWVLDLDEGSWVSVKPEGKSEVMIFPACAQVFERASSTADVVSCWS